MVRKSTLKGRTKAAKGAKAPAKATKAPRKARKAGKSKETAPEQAVAAQPLNVERRLEASTEQTEQEKARFLSMLKKALGNVSQACASTGTGRTTHYRWMKEDAAYANKVAELADEAIDFASSKLFELINGVSMLKETGKFDKDGEPIKEHVYKRSPCFSSIQFYLRTKGRKDGFGEQQVVIHKETDVIDPQPNTKDLPEWLKDQ